MSASWWLKSKRSRSGDDHRPGLLHVGAEHLAQRPVEDVGGGVVAADGVAPGAVDAGGGLVALGDRALFHHAAVEDQPGQAVLRVVDAHPRARRRLEHPGVADLPTGLGVERRAVEHDAHRGAGVGLGEPLAPADERAHLRADGLVLLAAGEVGRAELVDQLAVELERRALALAAGGLVRFLGAGALLLHPRVEAVDVDAASTFPRDLAREVDREPERVVQEERVVAGDVAAPEHAVEQVEPARQGLTEALLLAAHDPEDQLALLHDLGVRTAHHLDGGLDQRRRDELLGAEQERVAHRAPDDAPQHVAALLVRRHHAVGDEERHRAAVLGEDAQRDVARGPGERAVLDAGDGLRRRDQRPEDVDVPHRRGVLQHGEVALEPGAGVDARRRQRHQLAVRLGVELHEHEVPDLDVAVLVLGRAGGGTELGAEVPEDLRARAARAGVGHAPEVVVAEALDALGGQPDGVAPDGLGFVVGGVDGHPEALGIEAEHLGVELPRPLDRLALEVVAEAEVAQHLEEREVAVGATDVVEVVVLAAGAHALLHRSRPAVRRGLVTDEVGLERHHARVREQQRVVVRDQARRRDEAVVAGREEVEEDGAQLVGSSDGSARRGHGTNRTWWVRVPFPAFRPASSAGLPASCRAGGASGGASRGSPGR